MQRLSVILFGNMGIIPHFAPVQFDGQTFSDHDSFDAYLRERFLEDDPKITINGVEYSVDSQEALVDMTRCELQLTGGFSEEEARQAAVIATTKRTAVAVASSYHQPPQKRTWRGRR